MRLRSQRLLEEPRLNASCQSASLDNAVTRAPLRNASKQIPNPDMMLIDDKSEPEDERLSDNDSDDDDDEEDDESEGEQAKHSNWGHDPNAEALPKHAAFDADLPDLKARHLAAATMAVDVIKEHSSKSDQVSAMLPKAAEMVKEVEVQKKVIGLVGDTGMGKSATINSITGIWGIAKADASGQSCTQVVTIYKHKLDFQDVEKASFATEIRYLDADKRHDFIEEQLANYNRCTFEAEDDWDEEQLEEYEYLRDEALALFQSLFCNREVFSSPQAAQEYLRKSYDSSDKPALQELDGWCSVHFAGLEVRGNAPVRRFATETLEDLNAFLEPHVYQRADMEKPFLSSLIEHVSIGATKSEILRYIDLVDLPGISDINSVRAKIAHSYVKHCNMLLVFDQIRRCLTDPALDKILGTYGQQFGSRMVVVITHSDDTGNSDNVIARTLQGDNRDVGDYFILAQLIRKHEYDIRKLTKRIDKRQKRLLSRQNKKNAATLTDLKAKRGEKREELRIVKNRKLETLVDARNSSVVQKMQTGKSKYMPPGVKLEIHCISNTHYQSLCDGGASDGLQLDATHTGVPALRAQLLLLTARTKLRAMEDLIGKATMFMRGVGLWLDDTPLTQRGEIMEIIHHPTHQWTSLLDEYTLSVAAMFTVQIIEPLRDGRVSSLEGARSWISSTLSSWHHSSKLAFFAKNGNHKTKKIGSEVWNERFLDVQTNDVIQPQWPTIQARQHELLTGVVEEVIALLKAIPGKLNDIPNAVALGQEIVKDLVRELVFSIYRALENRMEELGTAVAVIKTEATKDIPSGYFTIAMEPTYDECNTHIGTGKMRRKFAVLNRDMDISRASNAFDEMAIALERELNNKSRDIASRLQSDVQGLLTQLSKDFQQRIDREIETPAVKQARRDFGSSLDKVKPALNAIVVELEAIKARY